MSSRDHVRWLHHYFLYEGKLCSPIMAASQRHAKRICGDIGIMQWWQCKIGEIAQERPGMAVSRRCAEESTKQKRGDIFETNSMARKCSLKQMMKRKQIRSKILEERILKPSHRIATISEQIHLQKTIRPGIVTSDTCTPTPPLTAWGRPGVEYQVSCQRIRIANTGRLHRIREVMTEIEARIWIQKGSRQRVADLEQFQQLLEKQQQFNTHSIRSFEIQLPGRLVLLQIY